MILNLVWVFKIPPKYQGCDLEPEECEALGAPLIHEFDQSVDAPSTLMVMCEEGQRADGLPDWTWRAEGFTFHRPIPRYIAPDVSITIHEQRLFLAAMTQHFAMMTLQLQLSQMLFTKSLLKDLSSTWMERK